MGRPKGRPKGGRKGKGSDWVETCKCHWCDLPGHLVRDCPAKKAGKPQEAGLPQRHPRKGARKGGRSAKSLENKDYEESMLGQDRDSGSLQREGFSVDIDEGVCGVCEASDYAFEDFVDDASQEASSHLPEDG